VVGADVRQGVERILDVGDQGAGGRTPRDRARGQAVERQGEGPAGNTRAEGERLHGANAAGGGQDTGGRGRGQGGGIADDQAGDLSKGAVTLQRQGAPLDVGGAGVGRQGGDGEAPRSALDQRAAAVDVPRERQGEGRVEGVDRARQAAQQPRAGGGSRGGN